MSKQGDDWQPVCPHARKVEGATPASAGVVCGVMEEDQKRADPIMEGAPIGVFISLRDDPSTLANLCVGQGEPMLSPDELPNRAWGQGHYSGCPIYAAEQEMKTAERLFALAARPEVDPDAPGVDMGPMDVTPEDLRALGL